MPDNIPITPGLGVTVATDQDSVTGAHYQRVKLMDGTEASSDPIVSDGKCSLRVRTADEDMLKDGNASVKVANDQTQPVPVQLDRYGRSLSGNAVPVVLATDHDAVPVTSASLPLVGGAMGANGAIFGPIPLVGCNGVLVQLSGTYNLTVIFEATVLDPTTGPWVSVNGTRTNNGQIDTNPAVNSLNAAWDFFLAGFTYFRIRITAFTSGLAQFQVARYTNAQDPTPSVVAQGASATGTASTGSPLLVPGSDRCLHPRLGPIPGREIYERTGPDAVSRGSGRRSHRNGRNWKSGARCRVRWSERSQSVDRRHRSRRCRRWRRRGRCGGPKPGLRRRCGWSIDRILPPAHRHASEHSGERTDYEPAHGASDWRRGRRLYRQPIAGRPESESGGNCQSASHG